MRNGSVAIISESMLMLFELKYFDYFLVAPPIHIYPYYIKNVLVRANVRMGSGHIEMANAPTKSF